GERLPVRTPETVDTRQRGTGRDPRCVGPAVDKVAKRPGPVDRSVFGERYPCPSGDAIRRHEQWPLASAQRFREFAREPFHHSEFVTAVRFRAPDDHRQMTPSQRVPDGLRRLVDVDFATVEYFTDTQCA